MNEAFQLTEEELKETRRQARVEVAKRCAENKDILGWGKALFPEKFPLAFCVDLHDYLISIRADALTNTEAPRNHAKTVIKCFLVPIFQALEEPKAYKYYLNVQATQSKALSVNRAIKHELENNPELREMYGDQVGENWTDWQFVLRNGVIFGAISAGQSIRGINWENVRPDYIVVDDLYDEEDINNPDSTIKKNDWFWSSLYPARAKSRFCSIHVQGTAINNEDLLEKLKTNARWKSRTFRAVLDWDTKDVLWRELNSFDSLMADKEDMGSLIFFRELQNERRDETTAIIKRSWLKDWEYEPTELYQKIRETTHITLVGVIMGNDPSIGEKVENDFTGTALLIKTQANDGVGNDYWIERLSNEHHSLVQRIDKLLEFAGDQPKDMTVTAVNIEAVAGFGDYSAEVIRKTNLPVHEMGKDEGRVRDKISNLINKSHFFENGKVHINKHLDPKLKDMIFYQLTTNHPRHDDLRDAVLLCLDDTSGLWNFV